MRNPQFGMLELIEKDTERSLGHYGVGAFDFKAPVGKHIKIGQRVYLIESVPDMYTAIVSLVGDGSQDSAKE